MESPDFEIFFLQSTLPMTVASTDGYIKRANPAIQRALGYSEAELQAIPYFSLVHPEDAGATGDQLHQLEAGTDAVNFINRLRCRDGRWLRVAWRCPAPRLGSSLLYAEGRILAESPNNS